MEINGKRYRNFKYYTCVFVRVGINEKHVYLYTAFNFLTLELKAIQ